MKNFAQFLVLPAIVAVIAMLGGCSRSDDRDNYSRNKEHSSDKNYKNGGCRRCGGCRR